MYIQLGCYYAIVSSKKDRLEVSVGCEFGAGLVKVASLVFEPSEALARELVKARFDERLRKDEAAKCAAVARKIATPHPHAVRIRKRADPGRRRTFLQDFLK